LTPGNPDQNIPIYAPVGGCAVFDQSNGSPEITIEVNQTCPASGQLLPAPRLQILLTHLKNPVTGNIVAGSRIADFCNDNDWINHLCGMAAVIDTAAPVHVAFQLRVLQSNGSTFYWPLPAEYLKFLAMPSCLYDRWSSANIGGTPTVQPSSTAIQSCP